MFFKQYVIQTTDHFNPVQFPEITQDLADRWQFARLMECLYLAATLIFLWRGMPPAAKYFYFQRFR